MFEYVVETHTQKSIPLSVNSVAQDHGGDRQCAEIHDALGDELRQLYIDILILGAKDHGKSTLLSALDRAIPNFYGSVNDNSKTIINIYDTNYEYHPTDYLDYAKLSDHIDWIATPTVYTRGIILVASAPDILEEMCMPDAPLTDTRIHALAARKLQIPCSVVLNKADSLSDSDIESAALGMRALLRQCEFLDRETPIALLSAYQSKVCGRYGIPL